MRSNEHFWKISFENFEIYIDFFAFEKFSRDLAVKTLYHEYLSNSNRSSFEAVNLVSIIFILN